MSRIYVGLSVYFISVVLLRIFLDIFSNISHQMPRDIEPSLNEKEFVKSALSNNLRLDGRAFDCYRSLRLSFGDESGVAQVDLGKTKFV